MKKFIVTTAVALVLAGSAFSISLPTESTSHKAAPVTKQAIPPAGCPVNDPNGCGIFG